MKPSPHSVLPPLREHGVAALVTAFYVASLAILQVILVSNTKPTILSSC
jgi:hypothetical protein